MLLHKSQVLRAILVLWYSTLREVRGGPLFFGDVPLPGGATTSAVFYSGDSAYGRGSDVCRCQKVFQGSPRRPECETQVPFEECRGVIEFFEAQLPEAELVPPATTRCTSPLCGPCSAGRLSMLLQ